MQVVNIYDYIRQQKIEGDRDRYTDEHIRLILSLPILYCGFHKKIKSSAFIEYHKENKCYIILPSFNDDSFSIHYREDYGEKFLDQVENQHINLSLKKAINTMFQMMQLHE